MDKYLEVGFTRDDFIFYQKNFIIRNKLAHVIDVPPSIQMDEFKANIDDEINELSNLQGKIAEEIKLEKLLKNMKKLF